MDVPGNPPKCYNTQRKRGGREGGVHCCRQNVIKRTRAPAGREREGGGR